MTSISMTDARPVMVRGKPLNWVFVAVSMIAALIALGWIGLRIQPAPFPAVQGPAAPPDTMPIPAGLPAPVERFYRQLYGERVPVIRSAVISGRGTMRLQPLFNLQFPVRFRFTHEAGANYRHYIEVTMFGLPILKVNEYYVDGKERQELPWAVAENNPKLDQGGNTGMWAEIIQWLPAALLTTPQVRWEPIDDDTALLVVPFGTDVERFVVRFDPISSKVQYWEVMRYLSGKGEKTLWINGTWFEEGSPWFLISEEDVIYNVDVDTSLSAKGP